MKTVECDREQDVIAAVISGRWPDRCETDLRAHVAACGICRDVAEVAVAFGAEQDHAASQAVPVPSAAHMWWRLQMRARQDAARAAIRPMSVVQGLVGAAIAGVAVAVIAFGFAGGWWPFDADTELGPAASGVINAVVSIAAVTPQTTLVLGAIAAGLILMPVAVYFALSE